jgi:hypothetical protein
MLTWSLMKRRTSRRRRRSRYLSPGTASSLTGTGVLALAGLCKARAVASRNLYLQFVFAWLTGNGDLHAKNAAVLEGRRGGWVVAPCMPFTGSPLNRAIRELRHRRAQMSV